MLRRVRGVVSSGLVWMLIWGAIGASLSIVIGIVDPPAIGPGEGPADLARIVGSVGVLAGVTFALLLTVGERRTAVADVSVLRAASWGALAGAAVGFFAGVHVANAGLFGVISGMLHGSLARAARRFRPAAV